MNNSIIIIVIFCVIIIALIFSINSVYLSHTPANTTNTTNTTTYLLSKYYPLTGVGTYNNVLFYTNTSPTGCISYAIIKNYEYNVTSQSIYSASETKITNATKVEKLYNDIGSIPNEELYTTAINNISIPSEINQTTQTLLMTINGTSNYVTILQNQTLLCGG